jgi:hypothetical protein
MHLQLHLFMHRSYSFSNPCARSLRSSRGRRNEQRSWNRLLLRLQGSYAREAVVHALAMLVGGMLEERRGARSLKEGRLADGALNILGRLVLYSPVRLCSPSAHRQHPGDIKELFTRPRDE